MLQLMGNKSLVLAGLRLLVVDNAPDTRELLIFVFEEAGAETIAAAAVTEVLEALKWLKPDILTSEIRLPNEDGYSLVSKIRKLETERGRQILAIAVTANAKEGKSSEDTDLKTSPTVMLPGQMFELEERLGNPIF